MAQEQIKKICLGILKKAEGICASRGVLQEDIFLLDLHSSRSFIMVLWSIFRQSQEMASSWLSLNKRMTQEKEKKFR